MGGTFPYLAQEREKGCLRDYGPEPDYFRGQSGVDRAALDVALELGVPCGGWCPKGRLAEDGPIADRYPLKETLTSQVSGAYRVECARF